MARAFAGNFTSEFTDTVTLAVQPFVALSPELSFGLLSVTSSTRPTGTSLSFTADCGTRSSTLSK